MNAYFVAGVHTFTVHSGRQGNPNGLSLQKMAFASEWYRLCTQFAVAVVAGPPL